MPKKLYNDLVNTSFTFIVIALIGVASGILFPRFLGPEQFGLWSITISIIGLLAPIAQLAMSTALATYISKYKNNEQKITSFITSAYFITIITSLIISIILFLLGKYIALSVFGDKRLIILFFIAPVILFFSQLYNVNCDYFRGFKNFKKYNLQKIITESLLFIIPLTLILFFSKEAIYLAISNAIIYVFVGVFVLIYISKTENLFKLFNKLQKEDTIKLLKFGVPLIFTATFMLLMKSIDKIFIGYFLDISNVGVYSVAATIPLMIGSLFSPIGTVLLPTFSERFQVTKNSELFLNEIFSLILFISIPSIIFIFYFSEPILYFLMGAEYIAGSNVLFITSFELLFYSGYTLFSIQIVASEKTFKLAIGLGITALINVCFNIILIPIFGIEGAAIATSFSFFILFVYTIFISKFTYNFQFNTKNFKIYVYLILSLIFIGFLIKLVFNGLLSLMITGIIFFILTSILVYFSSPLWFTEIMLYLREIKSWLKKKIY